jgi:predicted Rossmann fold nucleotide-binding protein DprA/Smf involved in DNA uptake
MEYSEALAAKIEVRITELKSEIDAHERALAALRGRENASASNGAASARNAATSRRRTTTPRAGNRRPRRSRTTSAEAVFDALKDGQDQAALIAKQFGVSPAVVRSRLQQLEEAGRVSRTGNRRSTRWRSHAG